MLNTKYQRYFTHAFTLTHTHTHTFTRTQQIPYNTLPHTHTHTPGGHQEGTTRRWACRIYQKFSKSEIVKTSQKSEILAGRTPVYAIYKVRKKNIELEGFVSTCISLGLFPKP